MCSNTTQHGHYPPQISHAAAHAVTLIQRFGGALLNLNVHLMCMDARIPRAHECAAATHMLLLDGVYVDGWTGPSTNRIHANKTVLSYLDHPILSTHYE